MDELRRGRLKEKDVCGEGICQVDGQHLKEKGGKVCMLVKELEKAKMLEKGSEQGGETAGPSHSVL